MTAFLKNNNNNKSKNKTKVNTNKETYRAQNTRKNMYHIKNTELYVVFIFRWFRYKTQIWKKKKKGRKETK